MSDDRKTGKAASPPRKRGKRPPATRAGELWARCPECRMPVKDAELFKHLLNCPGAEVRQQEWKAQQAAATPEAPPVAATPDAKPEPEGQPPE